MKNIILTTGTIVLMGTNVSTQIGVNTTTPKTTMYISTKRKVVRNRTILPMPEFLYSLANTAIYRTHQTGTFITDVSILKANNI